MKDKMFYCIDYVKIAIKINEELISSSESEEETDKLLIQRNYLDQILDFINNTLEEESNACNGN
ncbi:MAG: hypothetical protein IJ193_00180 [Bacilli bacterium]|nr:hypothetical protein [Bacilli bacterium]